MPMHSEFSPQWEALGYLSTNGSCRVVPPPPRDLIRAYHLTAGTHAISTLALARLKVSRLTDLNDPFDTLAVMWRELEQRPEREARRSEIDGTRGLLCFSAD